MLNYVAVLVKSALTDPLKALSEPQPSDSASCNGAETLIIARALYVYNWILIFFEKLLENSNEQLFNMILNNHRHQQYHNTLNLDNEYTT